MKLVKTFTVTCGEQASEFMLGRVSGMLSTINVNKYEFIMQKLAGGAWEITVEGYEDDCWRIKEHIEWCYPGLCKFAFVDRQEV